MKISYNWLKEYVNTQLSAEEAGKLLTGCGLEVESVELHESVKGGLRGVVVGEVLTREKHPDADRLSVTTVDVGTGAPLNIVCGAANVAAGQKVLVATVGAKLYPSTGDPIEIKKSKIRGAVSEGMICAEDELGLGTSHDGIMVLPAEVQAGTPAAEYFKMEGDHVLEIGLTPNRADATSHIGVARDLVAVLNVNTADSASLKFPELAPLKDLQTSSITVTVEDTVACPRYSAIEISNIKVGDSPDWLKERLKAIGLRPINNIVDITNYVMHETGQPMHAFDADKVRGAKVIIKKLAEGSVFTTLDGTERKLSAEDLMICDAEGGMCIAGVFGGISSGVTESTTRIFLESAYFNASSVRRSARRHSLKTDASFRFERGTDPNATVMALRRALYLISDLAGGEQSSALTDIYANRIEDAKVPFSFEKCQRMIGKNIDHAVIKNILQSLEIGIDHEGQDALLLSVPPFKVDVTREQDVIEEILRIYGYNKIDVPSALNASLSFSEKPDKERVQEKISEMLSNRGFSEMMALSLTREEYSSLVPALDPAQDVRMLNPLSSDLAVLRQTMLFSGLEALAYNINRKSSDLKLFEFGKTYQKIAGEQTKYVETPHLSLFMTGRKLNESWNAPNDNVGFYTLKGVVSAIFERMGITVKESPNDSAMFSQSISLSWNKRVIAELGSVSKSLLKAADLRQEVFYADIRWAVCIDALRQQKPLMYTEVPKFPEVRRDLALLIDQEVKFEQLEQLAYQTEKNLLKSVRLFDVYEGDKLPKGKKSYALSFTLQDLGATLTDKQIDKIMEKLIKTYQEKAGAEIR